MIGMLLILALAPAPILLLTLFPSEDVEMLAGGWLAESCARDAVCGDWRLRLHPIVAWPHRFEKYRHVRQNVEDVCQLEDSLPHA
eukprot:scaffold285179_cov27-Tisochrysis_lutea.AAC.2